MPNSASSPDISDSAPRLAILLLENDPNQADPICDTLRFAGYGCVSVRSIASARQEVAKPDPQFAVMVADLNLTRSEHIAFVRETRRISQYATLPIIIATGHDSHEAHEQARLLGYTDYLLKPFATSTLLQLIARWTRANP